MRVAALICVALALSGCATTRPVPVTKAFDANQAQYMLRRGTNIVTGSALIRQNGGGVVTCAGTEVSLVPATDYATERMQILYRSTNKGYLSAGAPNWINPPSVPAETDSRYLSLSRRTICDAQGKFEFADVADGSYYVTTAVLWRIGYNVQGGNLMQRVDLPGSSPVHQVVLTP